MIRKSVVFLCFIFFVSCQDSSRKLHTVTVAEFAEFVKATNYITDAEKFGWSFVQKTVYDYVIVNKVDWRNPTGAELAKSNFPVTQISYNDAQAYCKWANASLPSYEQYWDWAQNDSRPINYNTYRIVANNEANVIGNVWDLTKSVKGDEVRLAGGSFLCSENTCNGILEKRVLYVDKTTANSHISFSIVLN